ncbi:MAG: ASCH domain protein [Acidimicrobiia bacterium]
MANRAPGRVALLSIHPRHAEAILKGKKLVELRRRTLASDVTHVLIYATTPIKAVVGWFQIEGIEANSKTKLWDSHGAVTGISRKEFQDYFAGAATAFAIKVGDVRRLDPAISLDEIPGVRRAPQSFQYLDADVISWVFASDDSELLPVSP